MAEQELNPYAAPLPGADLELWSPAQPAGGLATLWQRLFGALLDLVLVAITIPVAATIVGFMMSRMRADEVPSQLLIMGPFFGLAGLLGLVQWTLIARSGQSIGKRVLKTRIVRLDGSNPGFIHGVLLRSWVPSVVMLVPLLGQIAALIDPLYVFFEDRRSLRDHIANTKVIQT
jgi:uncharacterized RDD family membrane protein YckC